MFRRVSIILPVYNAENFIFKAVESVLEQSFTDWQLIIINDGSTDNSLDVILQFNDPRIQVFNFSENRGLVHALNTGIEHATGEYLARMDADDICNPTRLEKQVRFLEEHPDTILLGTHASLIDPLGRSTGSSYKPPEEDRVIRAGLLFGCPFIHPTIMIRKSVLHDKALRYNAGIKFAQDYTLYSELWQYGKMANLQEPLLQYRIHPNQVTDDRNSAEIIKGRVMAWNNLLVPLEVKTGADILFIHDKISYYPNRVKQPETAHFPGYLGWLALLKQQNRKLNVFDPKAFEANIATFAERTLCHPLLPVGIFIRIWWGHASLLKPIQWLMLPLNRVKNVLVQQMKRGLKK